MATPFRDAAVTLVEAAQDPSMRLELRCAACDHRRRAPPLRVLAWLKRFNLRRLDVVRAEDVARYLAGRRCPDCGGRSWSGALIRLPRT